MRDLTTVTVKRFSRTMWQDFVGRGKRVGKTTPEILKEAITLWVTYQENEGKKK